MIIRPLDIERLRTDYENATPFPHFVIEDFLDPEFAAAVAASYPTFEEAQESGREFNAMRERRKIQVSERSLFPDQVLALTEALESPEFLADLEAITGIRGLESDPRLGGGGIHVTGPGGRLDVHVDFNYNQDADTHRRLNILIYLNPEWEADWGGEVELWDPEVKRCHQRVAPKLNRCVLFETSSKSFHGVRPVSPKASVARQSFAAYYYTKDAPADWDGSHHDTIFRARPDETLRRLALLPAERVLNTGRRYLHRLTNVLRGKR